MMLTNVRVQSMRMQRSILFFLLASIASEFRDILYIRNDNFSSLLSMHLRQHTINIKWTNPGTSRCFVCQNKANPIKLCVNSNKNRKVRCVSDDSSDAM
ncbi:hypothetical protein CEXT_146251 [Caerostris extrusa]|uniref:Secreted protein n=1 Tax=Caerostris extrusa TaxID=172846 RepID=A0AAV4XM49_CAEEX|nr:hypothetical protein CEXT_146251 [Caerostris extrusa]